MEPAVVILPKFAELSDAVGPLRFTRLNALVISPRAWTVKRSKKRKSRKMAMSTLREPGLERKLCGVLPSGPVNLLVNAAVLNHMFAASERERCGSRKGSPINCGRSVVLPSALVSAPVVMFNGVPLRSETMDDTVQPFNVYFRKALAPWK